MRPSRAGDVLIVSRTAIFDPGIRLVDDCKRVASPLARILAPLGLLVGLAAAMAQGSIAASLDAQQQPIRVEMSQPVAPRSGWELSVSLLASIAWPAVAIVALVLFRAPLTVFLDTVSKRATEISVGGLGIKLPVMQEAQLGEDVLTFRAAETTTIIYTSGKSYLFNMFAQSLRYEFVAVNLGRGDKWLSSRLYIFATMLQRMKGLQCIVFLAPGPDTESEFIGAMAPEKVRWGLARLQPWLEVAYGIACASPTPMPILDENGAIDPEFAEQLVRNFVSNLTSPPPLNPDDPEWIKFAVNQPAEHATWLGVDYVLQGLGHALWREKVVESETRTEAIALLNCTAPFVARVKKNGEFVALIDRVAYVDEVAGKVRDKMRANAA